MMKQFYCLLHRARKESFFKGEKIILNSKLVAFWLKLERAPKVGQIMLRF